jgi:hypothetical protein
MEYQYGFPIERLSTSKEYYDYLQEKVNIENDIKYGNNQKRGGNIAKKAYRIAANLYRRNNCNGRSRDLYDGEYHYPPCFNFCGPGTKVERSDVRNYPPYNDIDNICRIHDLSYTKAKGKANKSKLIREADKKMLEDLENYKDQEGYSAAKAAINLKTAAEGIFRNKINKTFPDYYGEE